MITLKGISKRYVTPGRTFTALSDVNLQIRENDHLVILGRSGSGKSTLLNIIAGIDRPTEGSIEVGDTKLGHLKESQLAAWRGKTIGVVFQFFQLIPTLSILENILLAMEFARVIPKKERRERVVGLLRQVGLQEHAHKLPAMLSGGEQQRAAISRALANDPPILIADEPTGNLDSKTAMAVNELFRSLSEMGKTIVTVTHDETIAKGVDRVVTMEDGKLIG